MIQLISLIFKRIWNDIKKGWAIVLVIYLYIRISLIAFGAACPMVIFLGLPCPGCGLTRAGMLFLNGDFADAWRMHPFIYAWLFLFLYVCFQRYIKGTKATGLIPMVILITLTMVAFYIYRMYMFFPDTEPMTQRYSVLYEWLRKALRI